MKWAGIYIFIAVSILPWLHCSASAETYDLAVYQINTNNAKQGMRCTGYKSSASITINYGDAYHQINMECIAVFGNISIKLSERGYKILSLNSDYFTIVTDKNGEGEETLHLFMPPPTPHGYQSDSDNFYFFDRFMVKPFAELEVIVTRLPDAN